MDPVIPKTADQITKEWILENTGLNPAEGSIFVDGNIQKGIGFLSNLCRVTFKTEDGSDKNILIKLLPEKDEDRALVVDQQFDKIEIKFYNLVKPELLRVCPELEISLCKGYGGKYVETEDRSKYASMLIMEDLKPAGYQNLNPESENWEANLEKALIFIAQFHAAGVALEVDKNAKISELFPFCMGVDDSSLNLLMELVVQMTGELQEILKTFNCPEQIKTSYLSILEDTRDLMRKIFEKGSELPSLIQGDLWSNNIMVAGPQDPVKIIDWQLLGCRDPAYEVAPMILTCIPKQAMKKEVVEKFARFYYKEFEKVMRRKGLDNSYQRSEQEFIDFFNTWGMCYAYIWFLGSIVAFPNDRERLYKAFVLLHDQYNVVEMMKKM